jgi:Domain of unknown function (DUF4386)
MPDGPDHSSMAIARIAGLLWLVTVATGLFAEAYVRGSLAVEGDPAATAQKIIAFQQLYRLGLAADLIGDLAYAGVTLILYFMLRETNQRLATGQLCFGMSGAAILASNLVNLAAPLLLLVRLQPLGGLSPQSLALLALGSIKLFSTGYLISMAFFSVQVALLGWIILRSRLFPTLFGWLFLLEALCNAVYVFAALVTPPMAHHLYPYVLLPGLPAEAGFALWLLVMGTKRSRAADTPASSATFSAA